MPIDTEAVAPADAARIAAWVAEHRLDALVSTDGDGDRPLVADETGAVLRGDAVGILTARALGADAVATPLNATTAIERSGWFARVERTRIGSPFVIAALERLAAAGAALPVGFEANGGFLLGGVATGADGRTLAPLPTRDAMTPILALLAAAEGRRRSRPSPRPCRRGRRRATAFRRSPKPAPPPCSPPSPPTPARARRSSPASASRRGRHPRRGADDPRRRRHRPPARLRQRPGLRVYTECATPEAAARLLAAVLARAAERVAAP